MFGVQMSNNKKDEGGRHDPVLILPYGWTDSKVGKKPLQPMEFRKRVNPFESRKS